MQFTTSCGFRAFGSNSLADLYANWKIYIGDEVEDHKLSCLSVGWSVGWLVKTNLALLSEFLALCKESRHTYIWNDL